MLGQSHVAIVEGESSERTETRVASFPDNLVELCAAHGKVVLAVMQRDLRLPLPGVGVLIVPSLLEPVGRLRSAVAVKTVAARGKFGEAARAVLAVVVAGGLRPAAGLTTEVLRSGRGSLDIAEVRVHWHTLADLRDAVLLVINDAAVGFRLTGNAGALLAEVSAIGQLFVAGAAKAVRGGLVGIGPGHGLDALLGGLSRDGGLRGMELEVLGDQAGLFGRRRARGGLGSRQFLLDGLVLVALLAEGRQGDAAGAQDGFLVDDIGNAQIEAGGPGALRELGLVQRRGSETSGIRRDGAVEALGRTRGDGRLEIPGRPVGTPRRSRRN